MPGNSLALQMPPAHQPRTSIPRPRFRILYLQSAIPDLISGNSRSEDSTDHTWPSGYSEAHAVLSAPKPVPRTSASRNLAVGVLPLLLPHA